MAEATAEQYVFRKKRAQTKIEKKLTCINFQICNNDNSIQIDIRNTDFEQAVAHKNDKSALF